MKKRKILGVILIVLLLLFSFHPVGKINAEPIETTTVETTSAEETEEITETIETTEEETESETNKDKKDNKIDDKKYGKYVMFVLLFGIPGALIIALGIYAIIAGFKQKKRDYRVSGLELLVSHISFGLLCGIMSFGETFVFLPLGFAVVLLFLNCFDLARSKGNKKYLFKIILNIIAIGAIVASLILLSSKDKTLDSEFVAQFFLAILVIINVYDSGKSLSKFLGRHDK